VSVLKSRRALRCRLPCAFGAQCKVYSWSQKGSAEDTGEMVSPNCRTIK